MRTSSRVILATAAALTLTVAAHAQPLQPLWSHETGLITMSSVRFADVDNDGQLEIIFGTMGPQGNPNNSGQLFVFKRNGDLLLNASFSRPIIGAIAIADLNGDGNNELIFTTWEFAYVLRSDGTNMPGWPKPTGVFASNAPALADLTGDGNLEILIAAGATMNAWRYDGTPVSGWPQTASAWSFSTPAVADITGDGSPEIFAGTTRPQYPDPNPPTFQLYGWRADGTPLPGFPVNNLNSIRDAIAIGDIDNNGQLEIVARTGDAIAVFNQQGQPKPGWPVNVADAIRNATATLGDLTGDGNLEIVIAGFDVHAYRHDGTIVPGFPSPLDTNTNVNTSPIIADVSGEGGPEILIKHGNGVSTFDAQGTYLPEFSHSAHEGGNSTGRNPAPAVGDLNGDGTVEIAMLSNTGTLFYFDLESEHRPQHAHWPMAHREITNTDLHQQPGTPCAPADLNCDGVVGVADLLILLSMWGPCADCGNCPADLTGDCNVGVADLLILLANWG